MAAHAQLDAGQAGRRPARHVIVAELALHAVLRVDLVIERNRLVFLGGSHRAGEEENNDNEDDYERGYRCCPNHKGTSPE